MTYPKQAFYPNRTFCITLPENPERHERAKKHFEERGVTVQFFEGIHAEKFGLHTIFTYEVDHPGTNYKIGFKSVGNFLSQYMLWAALNLLPDEHFMILEIDAEFPPDWQERLWSALQQTPPDFDMLFIGSCCTANAPKELISGPVWEVKYPACTHAFVVAKKALPILLRTQRKVYGAVDAMLIFHSLPLLKVYTVLPAIVGQRDTILTP